MLANTKKEEVALHGSHQGFCETGGCWLGFVRQEGEGGKDWEQGVVAMSR